MKKRKILAVIAILSVFALTVSGCSCTKEEKKEEQKPYVEAQGFEITPANQEYQNAAVCYVTNENGDRENVDGITFDNTNANYRFYDYAVVDDNDKDYRTISFKYDVKVPISCHQAADCKPGFKWYYSYSEMVPYFFDYYTGDEYRCFTHTSNGVQALGDEMKYTDITWNGNTYKIGVRQEKTGGYRGANTIKNDDGSRTYEDEGWNTYTVYISAPKDYDGLMVAIQKTGLTPELDQKNYAKTQRIKELEAQATETGQKSEELINIENAENEIYKVLQSHVDPNVTYNASDLYVIRVNDIPKAGEQAVPQQQ